MTVKKRLAALLFASLCAAAPIQTVSAVEILPEQASKTSITVEELERVILIFSHNCSISSGSGKILLNANTYANDTMAEIGIIDIEVQYSYNGTSGWTPLLFPSDQTDTYTDSHELEEFEISVFHQRYYRVKLSHYALEDKWISPNSQTITHTTNAVWVP